MKYTYTTRFNPTISGQLHIGHLYMALVNETEAHKSDGKFVVRVDDNNSYWVLHMGKNLIDQYFNDYQEQIEKFMQVDVWHRESQMPPPTEIIGDHLIFEMLRPKPWWKVSDINWKSDGKPWVWPYSSFSTFEKVIWDFWEGVNLLIRGEDLITESNLYEFFDEQVGLPSPHQVYLPRLMTKNKQDLGHAIESSGDIKYNLSKSIGTYTLKSQLDKFSVDEIIEFLRQSCLIDPEGEFLIENIKWNPAVVGFKK